MNIRKALAVVIASFTVACAWADTETVGDYTWTYWINGDTAQISGVSPSTGAVTIPSTLSGKPVTSIGSYAFEGCSGLTSVTIPDSVTSIGYCAFEGCSGLTSVTIPDGVTSIGDSAFYRCSGLTSVTIPDSVTSIGCNAFYGCSGLASVHITNLAKWCRISFGSGNPLYYAHNLYLNGEKITDLVIPNSVTSIGSRAFSGYSGLTSVTIPNSVTNIGILAFYDCIGLTSVMIPNSVTSIEQNAFRGCSDSLFDTTTILGVMLVDGWAVDYTDALSGNLNLTGVRGIGEVAFAFCSGLTSVTIPDSVTSIGYCAFEGCSGLTSVTIPDSVTSIGDYAFSGCSGMTSVMIPNSVTSIGYEAFYGCSGLTSVMMGCDCPAVEEDAFYGVNPSCVVYLPKGNATYVVAAGKWQGMKVQYYSGSSGDSGDEGTSPSEPTSTPTPVVVPELYDETEAIAWEVPATAASEYNGCLVDAKGNVVGSIQVKVGKPNAKTGLASVKATVVVGATKKSLKGADKGKAVLSADGPTELELVGGEACEIVLGAEGLSGTYGSYEIDGARNFFTSKDKAEQGAANALLGKWLGVVSILADAGNFTVTISAKGKAKVSGTLANGKKATGNAVFLVGEEWACVPVVLPKANISFALWLPLDGGEVVVNGLGDNVVAGRGGTLKAGAAFRIDEDEFAAVTGIAALPYLPDGVSVEPKGTKWAVAGGAKAGKVAYRRGTQEVDEAKLGDNPSGLKLTYKKTDGSFKGSFKVYAEVKGKLKATTVSVSGIVLNGVGYGTATVKGKGSVPVTIE